MFEKLLRVNEVAELLGISRSFVYQIIKRGQLTSVRIGTSVRVKRDDLDAFVNENSSKPADTTIVQDPK